MIRLMSRWLCAGLALLILSCATQSDSDVPTVLVPKAGSGAVRVRFQFNAGSSYDPSGKEGLAYFAAHALLRGTTKYTRAQIDEQLDALAARLDVEVDRDVTIIEGLCLTESWPAFSELLFSVLTEPAFDSVEMARLADDQIDAIEQLRRDDGDLAKEALQYYIYRNHPYGHPAQGLENSVETITAADARDFFTRHYTADNYILGLAGDVGDTLAQAIRKALGSHLARGVPELPVLHDPIITGLNVYLIEKENRAQAQLRFGRPTDIGRDDPDFMPLYLANTHLGRHRESMGRLYQEVRTKRGLSYGAYSYAEHYDQDRGSKLARPGRPRRQQYTSAWVYPKSENANFVIHVVMKELADLAENGLTQEQLDAARTFEINHFPFEIETPRRLLGMRMDELYLGTPAFVGSFADAASRVTTEDVQRAMPRAIDVNNMVIVAVVSDGQAFVKELLGDAVLVQYPSGVDPRGLRKDDLRINNFLPAYEPQKIRIVKASAMFQ